MQIVCDIPENLIAFGSTAQYRLVFVLTPRVEGRLLQFAERGMMGLILNIRIVDESVRPLQLFNS